MSYIGIPPFGQTIRSVTTTIATSGQTSFTITGGYVVGYVDVYLNGVLLYPSDYTATNGTDVVLASGAALNDEFQAISYQPVAIADVYTTGQVDSLLASFGAGATGGGSDEVFYENDQTVTTDYTITTDKNAMSTGPVTIDTGVTVTVPTGSRWVVI